MPASFSAKETADGDPLVPAPHALAARRGCSSLQNARGRLWLVVAGVALLGSVYAFLGSSPASWSSVSHRPCVCETTVKQQQVPSTLAPTPTPTQPSWKYERRACTGLGDRMSLIFMMAALGRVVGRTIAFSWCDIDPARPQSLEGFLDAFALPPTVVLISESVFHEWATALPAVDYDDTEIPARDAYDCIYTLGPRTFATPDRDHVDAVAFNAAFKAVGREWTSRRPLPAEIPPAYSYVAVHIRGEDKSLDWSMVNSSFCTAEAVLELQRARIPMVVITDDVMLEDHIFGTFVVRPNRTRGELFEDVNVLYHAAGVIQHSPDGWSAFSSSVATARGIPLLNTWTGDFNRIAEFEQLGGWTPELRRYSNQGDVHRFVFDVCAIIAAHGTTDGSYCKQYGRTAIDK
jgi:hypothetical protein